MSISNALTKQYIRKHIDNTRLQIGRNIHVYTPTLLACTLCAASGFLDSKSNTSTYIKCPICKGAYWVDTLVDHEVLARVHWTTNEAMDITPGGKFFVGDAYAVVAPEYHSLLVQAQNPGGKVVIDGQDMQIMRINPEGVPEINRYKLILRGMGSRPE